MGASSEELKTVGQLRKAIMPLVGLLKQEANAEITKRLEIIEKGLETLAKRDTTVEVKAPDVVVNVPTDELVAIIKSQTAAIIEKSASSEPTPVAASYEPHDQLKKGTFQYSGFVNADGDWYIQRVAKGEQRYAKGHGDYADAWDKVDKQKYGYIDG